MIRWFFSFESIEDEQESDYAGFKKIFHELLKETHLTIDRFWGEQLLFFSEGFHVRFA